MAITDCFPQSVPDRCECSFCICEEFTAYKCVHKPNPGVSRENKMNLQNYH